MSLKDKAPKSELGLKGKRPRKFELTNSTIHKTSSVDNNPPFSSYESPYLRRQKPTSLAPKRPFKRYLDNPPR